MEHFDPQPDVDVWRTKLGKVFDRSGQYGLPLSVGLFFGYWTADFGIPWLPTMLEILATVILLSLLLILTGYWLRGKLVRDTGEGLKVRRRIIFFLCIALIGGSLRLAVFWASQPTPLTRLTAAELQSTFELDRQRYLALDQQMAGLLATLEGSEFITAPTQDTALSVDQEELLRQTWTAFYDCAFALDQLRLYYEDWFRFDPSRAQRSSLLRSYMLTFAAELGLFDKSQRLIALLEDNRTIKRFLDSPHPEAGLAAGSFSIFRQEFQGARDQARVEAGERYMRWLETTLAKRDLLAPSHFEILSNSIERHLRSIHQIASYDRLEQTLRADSQILQREVRRRWYPAQKGVANWMGDTKLRRVGRYLIEEPELRQAADQFAPGDILLSRKNWYLSNVGLPGFWPHAILHLGDAPAFASYFDDPEVREWASELGAESFPDLLRRRYPSAWRDFESAPGGVSFEVLEAVGEGVILNTLKGAAGDYLAALRPRLEKRAKAQAIFEAFSHLGKPYDFDFDFATDDKLVCTEVVWRSYRTAPGKPGLDLPVKRVAGRLTLPANDIAGLYAAEFGSTDAQLDFVYFLDAAEKAGRISVASEEEFRLTPQRFKWDLLLD